MLSIVRLTAITELWIELKSNNTPLWNKLKVLSESGLFQSRKSPSEFKIPKKLSGVNTEFTTIERDESIEAVKKAIIKRDELSKDPSKDNRQVNVLLAVQSAPGGGKTTFLNFMAQRFSEEQNFFPVLVSFSNGTGYTPEFDETQAGIALRMFCRYQIF